MRDECPVCGVQLSYAAREACYSPACPCYGMTAGSAEMADAARAYRSRGASGTAVRSMGAYADPHPDEERAMAHARQAARNPYPLLTADEALRQLAVIHELPGGAP